MYKIYSFSSLLFILLCIYNLNVNAQQLGNLRGFVTDSTSGEVLVFCNVFIKDINTGASTNERGLYLIKSIPANKEYNVTISYVGYKTKELSVFVSSNKITQLDVKLIPLNIELQTIEKVGEKIIQENNTDISLEKISVKELEILPKGVESDIFRSLQNVPGVSTTGDVTARYYVRGGSGDQNLILLNGIELYNPFHSLGLFSVIDPEMINSIEFYKGGFTSEYTGRLSSVMRIVTKDGNKNRLGFIGSGSFLTAKGLLEGPIPNGSFMVTGRKSHNNNVLRKFFNKEDVPIDFYDFSFKLNYSSADIFENAKFSFFGFNSNDVVDYNDPAREGFKWNNSLFGFEWIQIYDVPLFSRLGVSLSKFNGEVIPNLSALKPRKNDLSDFNIKFDMNVVFSNRDEIGLGVQIKTVNSKFFQENTLGARTDIEKFGGNLSFYGKYKFLRYKNFGIDAGTRFNVTGLTGDAAGSFEPRINITYRIFPQIAIKAAWGIYLQQLVAISDEDEVISVFDPWIIIPDYLEPSRAIHYNGGIEFDPFKGVNFSIEGYYKIFQNLPVVNNQKFLSSDPDLIVGTGESYGWEFAFNYGIEPINFTAAYTLSWAYKTSQNWTYYPRYDNRHSLNLILEYNFGDGWIASMVWNYNSGYPFTELIGFYDKYYLNNINNLEINPEDFIPYAVLGDRNLGRLPDYHRLDVSLTKRFYLLFTNFEIGASAVNVYNRKNIFYFDRNTGKEVNMLPFLFTGTLKVEI